MIRDETVTATTEAVEPFTLNVLLSTDDGRLAQRVEFVCRQRGHRVARVELLSKLPIGSRGRLPTVLMLDTKTSAAESARIATAIAAIQPDVSIVLAAAQRAARSASGFRLIDKRWNGGRIVDELELAFIGIPAAVGTYSRP